MMWRASVTRSRALMWWPSSGRPEALRKADWVIPSSWARLVISSAKVASLPARPSATTTQASLPDWTMMPWISASTGTLLPASTNIRLPSIDWAWGLTVELGRHGDAAVAERLEEQVERHQLRHRGRRQLLVGVLLEEHHAGAVVDHQRLAGAGLEGAGGGRPRAWRSTVASSSARPVARGLRDMRGTPERSAARPCPSE